MTFVYLKTISYLQYNCIKKNRNNEKNFLNLEYHLFDPQNRGKKESEKKNRRYFYCKNRR